MSINRSVFISSPTDRHLDERRRSVKWAIVGEIERLGYTATVFGSEESGRGSPVGMSWSLDAADSVMRRCVGAAILGFPIWTTSEGDKQLASEYCHYEGALARAYKLPILSVIEEGVEQRVFFNRYAGVEPCSVPAHADENWVKDSSFQYPFGVWRRKLEERRDVFLGYSSGSSATAAKVKQYLEENLGATVLDWHDFGPSGSILGRIKEAASHCSAGVFLFTKDDVIASGEQAVPRDNVVFETGYFMNAKGEKQVLIILEAGSRIPADLGGKIFVNLADREDIASVAPDIKHFVEELGMRSQNETE